MKMIERLGFMVIGGMLVAIGICVSPDSSVTAQSDRFGEITCTRLTVKSDDSKASVKLGANREDGGYVSVHGVSTGVNVDINAKSLGAYINTRCPNNSRTTLSSNIAGNVLNISGKDGFVGLRVVDGEYGGSVVIRDKNEKLSVALVTDHDGGMIEIRSTDNNHSEKTGAGLGIDKNGGYIRIGDKYGNIQDLSQRQ